jgi:hypothetical protein
VGFTSTERRQHVRVDRFRIADGASPRNRSDALPPPGRVNSRHAIIPFAYPPFALDTRERKLGCSMLGRKLCSCAGGNAQGETASDAVADHRIDGSA